MKSAAVSDLSSAMRLQRIGQATRSQINTAGYEVASGQKSDLVKASGGDLANLFAIEKTLARLETRSIAISSASAQAEASQRYLEKFQANVAEFGANLIAAVDLGSQTQAFSVAGSGRGAFDSMVSALNGRFGDRALFAGANVDGPAVINAQSMYNDISALTLGAVNSASVISVVDDYFFSPAGGFAATGFLGDALNAGGAEISEGQVVDYAVRGDAEALRAGLRNVVLVAIARNGDHAGTALDSMNILREAGNGAIASVDKIILLREGLGQTEERLSNAAAFNVSRKNMFEMKRTDIIAADPYAAATRFQALQSQMEMVYLTTSRLSTMRLQNYLR